MPFCFCSIKHQASQPFILPPKILFALVLFPESSFRNPAFHIMHLRNTLFRSCSFGKSSLWNSAFWIPQSEIQHSFRASPYLACCTILSCIPKSAMMIQRLCQAAVKDTPFSCTSTPWHTPSHCSRFLNQQMRTPKGVLYQCSLWNSESL